MSTNDTTTQSAATAAPAKGTRSRKSGQLGHRHFALITLTLVALVVAVWRVTSTGADAGFVQFRPDVSMFPAPPVADASTIFGFGSPIGWPGLRSDCPYETSSSYDPAWNTNWRTVRHDWELDGDKKAWIVSERTIGFDNAESFDDYVGAFRDRVRYCGWTFGETGFNSIATEVDGLPQDALAFTVDADPQSPGADDFRALGAFIPGPKRGELMNVIWIGWGADIPRDEFAVAVNTLYDAAHSASATDYSKDNKTIDFNITEFDPERAGIMPIVGRGTEDASAEELHAPGCKGEYPADELWEHSAVDYIYAVNAVEDASNNVSIGANRWQERSKYLEAKALATDLVATPCIGTGQSPSLSREAIGMPGLPEGTIVSRWEFSSNWDDYVGGYAALITDDDKQMMMTISWLYTPGQEPEAKFVEVVNRAWDQFQTDNP